MILSDLPTGSEERVSGKHIFPDSDCLGTINMMAVYVLIGVLGLLLGTC